MFDANAAADRPYYDDPYRLEFDARVMARRRDERGEWVRLDVSWFYPESGGQEADRGWLADVAVLDVQSDESGAAAAGSGLIHDVKRQFGSTIPPA